MALEKDGPGYAGIDSECAEATGTKAAQGGVPDAAAVVSPPAPAIPADSEPPRP